jgi:hypothetical protein
MMNEIKLADEIITANQIEMKPLDEILLVEETRASHTTEYPHGKTQQLDISGKLIQIRQNMNGQPPQML